MLDTPNRPEEMNAKNGREKNGESEMPSWKFWEKRRYIVGVMAFFGFCIGMVLRTNLSIAIVAMTANQTKIDADGNIYYEKEFDWNPKTRGLLLSAYFYGHLSSQLLGGWLATRIGGKTVFGSGIGLSAVMTVLTPPLVRTNLYLLVVARVMEGLGSGVTLPSVHAIWANWAPPLERSKLGTLAMSGIFAGPVIAMPICGVLADRLGWSSVFYVWGALGLAWFATWSLFVTNKPEDDPYISEAELVYITSSMEQRTNEKIVHPWKDIMTSVPVWAIIGAHFSENWGLFTMQIQLPIFLSDTLDYELSQAGLVYALPSAVAAVMVQVGGHLADYMRQRKILTTTQVRKLFNCGGFMCQAIFMIGAAYITTPALVIFCITLGIGFGGFSWVGFSVNYLDIAPKHASIIMGIGNTLATLSGVITPVVSGHIVQNKTAAEWRIIFIISASIYFCGAVVYGLFASGNLQPWAVNEPKNENSMALLQKKLDARIEERTEVDCEHDKVDVDEQVGA